MEAVEAAPVRTVADIIADAMGATCGHCWSHPAQPCYGTPPRAVHVARLARAQRRGLISPADFMAVLQGPVVFTNDTVVDGTEGRTALCTAGSSPSA
jgi:hypothetical protein